MNGSFSTVAIKISEISEKITVTKLKSMSIKDFNIKPDMNVTAEKLGMALKSLVQEKNL